MLIEGHELKVSYSGGPPWLIDIDAFAFEPGTFSAIVGPSGVGKSTLLDVLGGLRRPDHGSLRFDGELRRISDLRRDVAWIAQTNPMLPARTAVDNAALSLLAEGLTHREARPIAQSALETLGLGDRAQDLVRNLSGGEVQRVSIARCLLASTPLVLADEPTGQLDALNTAEVIRALEALASDGKTVVVATHDPEVWNAAQQLIDLRKSQS